MMTLLLIVLIIALVGGLPTWGYSRNWGYSPVGIIVLIIVLLLIFGNGSFGSLRL